MFIPLGLLAIAVQVITATVFTRMATRVGTPGSVESWVKLGGAGLLEKGLREGLDWDEEKALILIGSTAAQLSEPDRHRLKEYFARNWDSVKGRALAEFGGKRRIPATWDTHRIDLFTFLHAPLWRLDSIAPDLDADLMRIVVQHRIWHQLISTPRRSTVLAFDPQDLLSSVLETLEHTRTDSLLTVRSVRKWSNAFVEAFVARKDLFISDLTGQARARVNFYSKELAAYFHLGRVLGLMLLGGVLLQADFFEASLYSFLVARDGVPDPTHEELKLDYPKEYAQLVQPAGTDLEKKKLFDFLPKNEQAIIFKMIQFDSSLLSKKGLIRYYTRDRTAKLHRMIARGFQAVTQVDLGVTSSGLRKLMVRS